MSEKSEKALIAMVAHDTVENQRSQYTKQTLQSLSLTVDLDKHPLYIVDNGSCEETKDIINDFYANYPCKVITNRENLGTSGAINLAWKERGDMPAIKIDNDVVIEATGLGWVDILLACANADASIGQVGLKRMDLEEYPEHPDPYYRSELYMLPHVKGEPWLIVEKSNHVIGTCVLHTNTLLNKVGYLCQPTLYGFDDVLMSIRCQAVGLKSVFYPHIKIHHIDTVPSKQYQEEKNGQADAAGSEYYRLSALYKKEPESVYYNPFQ